MWPTPPATAASISAISLATCRGDVPWARNRRSTPRSALSKVDRASKSTVASETPDGRRPASDVRVNATISTGSVNSFEIKAEPTRPVAPATAMRVRPAPRWEGLNIRITFRILERSVQDTWNDRSMMSSGNGMSGKPQFDDDAVINSAMDVFWRHGYSASSIDQLTTAMGLSRSSMYKRFQDKDGLFEEVLSAYIERVERRMSAVRGETKRQQLEALLHEFLPRAGKTARPAGCMLARSCAEMVDLPPAGQSVARQGLYAAARDPRRHFTRGGRKWRIGGDS
ncbi:AcrR family transcriptional regulator [Bradyrhizobium sp. i1.4.4]